MSFLFIRPIDISETRYQSFSLWHIITMNKLLRTIVQHNNTLQRLNKDIPDLRDMLAKNVPPLLKHACLSWSDGLGDMVPSYKTLAILSQFIYEKLLIWIEIMSLMGRYDAVGTSLKQAISYVKVGKLIMRTR